MSGQPQESRCEAIMVHLLRMTMVDGERTAEEQQLLATYRDQFSLSEEEMEACTAYALSDRFPILPDDQNDRDGIFYDVIKMAACDGVDRQEEEYLLSLAEEFEIDEDRVQQMIAWAQEGLTSLPK